MNNGPLIRRESGSPIVQNPAAVRRAREEAGLQQQALAAHLDISPELMCEIESGRRSANRLRLRRIAQITGAQYTDLLNPDVDDDERAESA